MMNYWEVKKLGDIAEISSGGTPSRNKKNIGKMELYLG